MRLDRRNAVPINRLFLIASLFLTCVLQGCGGSGTSSAPPPPPPPPTFQNPQVLWTGDAKMSSVPGDHGINDALIYRPGVVLVPDGSGGAFLAWEADVQGEVFVQRVDANGHPVWPAEVSVAPGSPFKVMPAAISDGAGGVIVAWVDGRVGFCDLTFKGSCDIYAQRFDASGNIVWQINGVPVVTATGNQGISGIAMVADGSGGALLAWEDARSCCTIFAQRIESTGQPMWAVDGIQVSPTPTVQIGTIGDGPQMIGDGAGGSIISWWNIQVVPNSQPQTLSVQKLDPTGTPLWASSGVTVAMQLMEPDPSDEQRSYQMGTDGAGGAVFVAVQNIDSATLPPVRNIVAQHVSSDGVNTWTNGGVPISSAPIFQVYPTLIPINGGAIVAFRECADLGYMNCDIAAQSVDSGGRVLWGSQGVPIVSAPNNQAATGILSDGAGGAIIVWNDCRNYPNVNDCYANMDIYGQQVNGDGKTLWQPNGFPISSADGNQGVNYTTVFVPSSYAFASDEQGGFLLAWPDGRDNFCFAPSLSSQCELFAQRIKP